MTDKERDFAAVFQELRAILQKHEKNLVVKTDEPGNYCLTAPVRRADGYEIWFAAVQIKKNYVSYHLMPVYMNEQLRGSLSPELRARMQGKACFNFKGVQPDLLKELAQLTRRGFAAYKNAGWVGK